MSLVAKICLDATENGPWKVRGKRATDGPSQRSATMIRTTPGMQPVPLNAGNQQNLGHFAHTFNTISLFDIPFDVPDQLGVWMFRIFRSANFPRRTCFLIKKAVFFILKPDS